MRTIEMYQDPKDGVYCTLMDLAKRNGIRIISARERYMEECSSIAGIISLIQIHPMPHLDISQYQNSPNPHNIYQNKSKKYSTRRETMSREHKHIARTYHGRERKWTTT